MGENKFRFQLVDFVDPFSSDFYAMVTKYSNVSQDTSNGVFFLTAFDLKSWFGIWIVIGGFVVVSMLDSKPYPSVEPYADDTPTINASFLQRARHKLLNPQVFYRMIQVFFSTFMAMLDQGQAISVAAVTKTSMTLILQRLILLVSVMARVFLLTSCQASITVLVFESVPVSPFRSIESLKECVITGQDLCVNREGASRDDWYFNQLMLDRVTKSRE
jgi:hypothetical protein